MSYDFLLRVPSASGEFPELEDQGLEVNPGPPVPAKEERKKRLANALTSLNPELSVYPFDFAEIAKSRGITEERARERHRDVELNGPEDGNGIQISLYDDEASVSIPFWHDGARAEATLQEAWIYLDVLQKESSYVTWDGQVGKILNLLTDFELVLEAYAGGVRTIRDVAAEVTGRKRPWWRFW